MARSWFQEVLQFFSSLVNLSTSSSQSTYNNSVSYLLLNYYICQHSAKRSVTDNYLHTWPLKQPFLFFSVCVSKCVCVCVCMCPRVCVCIMSKDCDIREDQKAHLCIVLTMDWWSIKSWWSCGGVPTLNRQNIKFSNPARTTGLHFWAGGCTTKKT